MLRGQLLPWTVLAVRYHSPDLSISFRNFIPIKARLTPKVCWGLLKIWSELRTHEFTVSNAFQLEESRTFFTIIDLYVTTSEIKLKIINLINWTIFFIVFNFLCKFRCNYFCIHKKMRIEDHVTSAPQIWITLITTGCHDSVAKGSNTTALISVQLVSRTCCTSAEKTWFLQIFSLVSHLYLIFKTINSLQELL